MSENKELIESLISEAQIKPWKTVWGALNEDGEPNLDFSEEQVEKYIDQIFGMISDIFNVFYERVVEVLDEEEYSEEFKKLEKMRNVFTNFRQELNSDGLKNLTNVVKKMGQLISLSHEEKTGFPPFFFNAGKGEFLIDDIRVEVDELGSLMAFYDKTFKIKKNIDGLIKQWGEEKIFIGRMDFLRDALEAHFNGKYTLSVPIFLIHINALFDQIHVSSDGKYLKLKDRKKIVENMILEKAKRENLHEDFLKDSILFHLMRDVLRPEHEEPVNSIYPNRHEILHGKDLGYHSVSLVSTKCIVMLDLLRKVRWDDYLH